jgi:hypothetical protein
MRLRPPGKASSSVRTSDVASPPLQAQPHLKGFLGAVLGFVRPHSRIKIASPNRLASMERTQNRAMLAPGLRRSSTRYWILSSGMIQCRARAMATSNSKGESVEQERIQGIDGSPTGSERPPWINAAANLRQASGMSQYP